MLLSKLREAVICFKAGRVTLDYPSMPHDPELGFRGKPTVDADLCIGCGGCASVCPANVIDVHDPNPLTREITFFWGRCTYCARCEEVCPEGVIHLTSEYQTATDNRDDLTIRVTIFMGLCQRCGRCFKPPTPLDAMDRTGFRDREVGGRA